MKDLPSKNCLLACSLLALLLLGWAGCDSKTQYHQARLEGVPTCPSGQMLHHAMCVELDDGADQRHLQVFSGMKQGAEMSLPDESRSWVLRAGLCENPRDLDASHYKCGECRTYWEREITTEPDTSQLVVPPPSQFECIGPQ